MTPLIPAFLTDAIGSALALPSIPFQLARIAEATDTLPEIHRDMARVAAATQVLPEVLEALEKVAEHTAALGDIEEHTTHIERMLLVLDRLDGTMETLVQVAEPLQGPAERLGRFADRFPRRSRG